jgi:CRP/FNR family cyclic AMP-dependent transcriptional regulator
MKRGRKCFTSRVIDPARFETPAGLVRGKMRSLTSLPMQGECGDCSWRKSNFFCGLPDSALREFTSIKITHAYPKGSMLFLEGQPADGVYILCAGRVKLSTYSEDGRSLIVRIAEAGELLGLSACAAGLTYEASAQITADCQVNFVRATEFLEFLNKHSSAAINAIRELSLTYHKAHSQICALGLSASVSDKLAKLFLEWYDRSGANGSGMHLHMDYTHEEIAEMIGTSRETVTRLLKTFKDRKLITLSHNELYIPDRKKLSAAIGSRHGQM